MSEIVIELSLPAPITTVRNSPIYLYSVCGERILPDGRKEVLNERFFAIAWQSMADAFCDFQNYAESICPEYVRWRPEQVSFSSVFTLE